MKKIFLLLLTIFTLNNAAATTIVGKISDEQQQPIAYASIYLKKSPTIGTVSNNNGIFKLDVGEQRNDVLIVSFIGYESVQIPLKQTNTIDTLIINLREQPIMIEETVVATKISKKQHRKAMKTLFANINEQLAKDFPDTPRKYKVVSDVSVYSEDNQTITFDELIGEIVELPATKKNKDGTIQILPKAWKRYINASVQNKMQQLNDNVLNKKEKAFVQKTDTTTDIHKMLWGRNPKIFFNEIATSPKKWSVSRENEELSVLTYTDSRNIMGIVRVNITINYVIGTYTYSLHKISQNATVNVNIPFGYKLSKDELAMLNVVNLSDDEIEKFRVKKATVNIKRNVIYQKKEGETFLKEKNLVSNAQIEDKNGNTLKLKNAATAKVLEEFHHNVEPFTAAELQQKAQRKVIVIDGE